jgi:hypothetical protein
VDIERRFRDLRRRECGEKVRHPTEAAALREAELMAREHGGRFSAYRCPWCRRWHVGSER